MRFELKKLRSESISDALEHAKHYRNLNDPCVAESICLDILEIEPKNEEATVLLLLSLTDQLEENLSGTLQRAQECRRRLKDPFDQAYYEGLICERQARAVMKQAGPRARHAAYNWLRHAMECYEQAAELKQERRSYTVLRWNTCARILNRNPHLGPLSNDVEEQMLE